MPRLAPAPVSDQSRRRCGGGRAPGHRRTAAAGSPANVVDARPDRALPRRSTQRMEPVNVLKIHEDTGRGNRWQEAIPSQVVGYPCISGSFNPRRRCDDGQHGQKQPPVHVWCDLVVLAPARDGCGFPTGGTSSGLGRRGGRIPRRPGPCCSPPPRGWRWGTAVPADGGSRTLLGRRRGSSGGQTVWVEASTDPRSPRTRARCSVPSLSR